MPTLAERLVEAETAYHSLMTGTLARVYVDQNGERVEYVAANASKLQGYIRDLKQQIADQATGCQTYNGPLRPFFL
ncbi:gpW family head-tail joining protein [Novosphingobium resinovorum]|uniref:GpW n=1 Tax=Novosphingobium resinovorum TaxID=158500 RepID=A0A1D8A3D5_9SPHN|nr:gpW family head-tail joining protein [Novosphingobium resinovorum]AOR76580.1 hypothetical protein BES08_07320 [Novosphingobium resinovorum]